MISLQAINGENWETCVALKPKPEQMGLVASNLYSIAEAQFLDGFSSMGIYKDNMMIGYALYGLDPDDHHYWIYRFMIDERFQGKGYGSMAIAKVIDDVRKKEDRTDDLVLGYKPDNVIARKLYVKAGFVEEGLAPWGEMIAKYHYV